MHQADNGSNLASSAGESDYHGLASFDSVIKSLSDHDSNHTCSKISHISPRPKYIKLNIGGKLFITTFETICSVDWMISRMLKSELPSIRDEDGFIVIDRCGAHFEYFLEFLREGQVDLPKDDKTLRALLIEAKFYCLQEFVTLIENKLDTIIPERKATTAFIVDCQDSFVKILSNASKPLICLTFNRSNNKYSYVERADDNFVRHNELFNRLITRFQGIVDFVLDIGSDPCEVCSWKFFTSGGIKRTEISCASIVYTPDRKQTKIDFPEAKIYEEALNTLLLHCGVCTHKITPKKDIT